MDRLAHASARFTGSRRAGKCLRSSSVSARLIWNAGSPPAPARRQRRQRGNPPRTKAKDDSGHVQPVLRLTHPQLSLRAPCAALGAGRIRPAHANHRQIAPSGRLHHPDPETAQAQRCGRTGIAGVRRRPGAFHREAAVRPHRRHQRGARGGGQVARAAARAMARHPGNRTPVATLAQPCLLRHPPVLLSGRGRRDCHLAHRGRPTARQQRQALPGPSGQGKR